MWHENSEQQNYYMLIAETAEEDLFYDIIL